MADTVLAQAALDRLHAVLETMPHRTVACSGGVDSLVLAAVSHRADPTRTVVVHGVSPAVPADAAARVRSVAAEAGWDLMLVETGELGDDRYVRNATDRCYHCKDRLYTAMERLAPHVAAQPPSTLVSGANLDDLADDRPGLVAAERHGIRHPFIEALVGKEAIRAIAQAWNLPFANIPASPCLASRLYTGTAVSVARLAAVDAGERALRDATGITVARCRIRENLGLIEVGAEERDRVTHSVVEVVALAMRSADPRVVDVRLDDRPYRPGRAVIRVN
ncbi:MAG: ATPase [Ilumatobacteraceae bacterium]